MKKLFATLAIVGSANALANTTPIEPVLVPVFDKEKNIDIQMGKYEVTVEEFTRFVNATGYEVKEECHLFNENNLPDKPHGSWNNPALTKEPFRPVVCVGAENAMAYASWLAKTTGKPYRLPEFYEWQVAASAGNSSRFAYGEDLNHSEVCEYENIEDAANNAGLKLHHDQRYRSSANCNDGAIYHTVVGMYRPNDLGLHDMMGNVRELLQTCDSFDKEQEAKCDSYQIVGSAWHWIPRPTGEKDSLPFVGSIEGFRLVLDTNKTNPVSKQTQSFIDGLAKAQEQAQVEHQRLKSLPKRPQAVRAKLIKDKQVELTWLPVADSNISYAVYRSYLDANGKLSRKMTKIADGIKADSYLDQLPGKGAASYQVFATNAIGESQASAEVFVGEHRVFNAGERIQAELYHHHRNTYARQDEEQQSIFFSSNEGHYPPELTPFSPAWLTYSFDSKKTGAAQLKMNVRGAKGAAIEFWQGKDLVAKLELDGAKDFMEKTVTAKLIKGNGPLQIRQGNNQFFVIDWFELDYL